MRARIYGVYEEINNFLNDPRVIFTLPNSFLCLLLGGQCAAVPHSSQIIGMRQFLFSFLLLTKFITMSVHICLRRLIIISGNEIFFVLVVVCLN